MERTLTTPAEPLPSMDLDLLLAEPAPAGPAAPFPAPGEEAPAEAADAFDAQILAGLVSP
jgi:hypothetical protein